MQAEELTTTEMVCVLPRTHALAMKRQIRTADLAGQSVISLGPLTRLGLLIEEAARKLGEAAPQIHIEASSSLTACLLVAEGAGVALVDRAAAAARRFEDLAFRPYRPQIPVPIHLIYPRDRPRARATQQLAVHLKHTARG